MCSHSTPLRPLCLHPFVAFLLLAAPGPGGVARAQNASVRHYQPPTSPDAILGVHASRGAGHLALWAGLAVDYANEELIARTGDVVTARPIAHRAVTELGLAFGLWGRLDLGISLPVVAGQWARGDLPEGVSPSNHGLGDLRLLLKGVALRGERRRGFGLAAVLELSVPTGRRDALMRDGSVTVAPRLVADFRFPCGAVVALNLGYRVRKTTWIGDLPVDDEVLLSAGGALPLGAFGLSVLASVDAALGLGRSRDSTRLEARKAPVEARFGLRWRHRMGLQATLGAGVGLTSGYGAPDVRVLLLLGYRYRWRRRPAVRIAAEPGPRAGPGAPGPRAARAAAGRRAPPGAPRPRAVRPGPARAMPPHHPRVETSSIGRPRALPPPPRPDPRALNRAAAQDPDPDGDGLPAPADRCPLQPEDRDGFEDQDGCPDPDNDQDGVPDVHDRCPLRPETVNGVQDEDGCPDKGRAQVAVQGRRIQIVQRVLFAAGSDQLRPESFPLLKQVAALIRKHWWIQKVRVEGHTDNHGDEEKNVDLSIRRAYRVRAFLVRQGVAPHRLEAKGYGPTRPVASNRTAAGRAKNRRVVFVIVKTAQRLKAGARHPPRRHPPRRHPRDGGRP